MGLRNCKSFSRIVIHPKNNNIIIAAGLGSHWGASEDHGVFKSIDGGETWKKVLYVNDITGVADLVMDPANPNNLLAGMWEYYRKPYTFQSGGKGSGIFRSTDGGETWKKITNGIPATTLGRTGFSYYRKDSKIVVAGIECKENEKGSNRYFKSNDGGETWRLLAQEGVLHGINTIGKGNRPFYFGPPRQDPNDSNRIYATITSGYWYSKDGGISFTDNVVVGADPHELWINPHNSKHMISATDEGIYASTDGATFIPSICPAFTNVME